MAIQLAWNANADADKCALCAILLFPKLNIRSKMQQNLLLCHHRKSQLTVCLGVVAEILAEFILRVRSCSEHSYGVRERAICVHKQFTTMQATTNPKWWSVTEI